MFGAKVGVGLAGAGYWGRNLARNLFQMGHLAAVCDPSTKVLKEMKAVQGSARRPFQTCWTTQGQAVAMPPPRPHYELANPDAPARRLRGEAPASQCPRRAVELGAARRRLMVVHILESHPAVRNSRARGPGELGDIHYVYSEPLNLGTVRREENIRWSFAPTHRLDPSPRRAMPEWASPPAALPAHDIADLTMTSSFFPQPRPHLRELSASLQGS